ncbi:MAG: ATP synthase F1 subunit delta [Candidatus Enteromonas sp.]|nr:ATP synthase F1 subunit delta [Candidatus Enteromonas sp.]MDY6093667.1 ATP synthase F1 subunit delta [Candidatus Enteromonas sp.]
MNELHRGYAQALFELSAPSDAEVIANCMKDVQEAFASCEDLRRLLCSPSFSVQEKDEAIASVFPQFGKIPHLLPFFHLVGKNGRWKDLPGICEAYLSLYYECKGIKNGILYGAFPMNDGQIAEVEKALGKKLSSQVVLRFVLDPSLIGGIKVAIDGKVFDGSIQNKLAELRAQLR